MCLNPDHVLRVVAVISYSIPHHQVAALSHNNVTANNTNWWSSILTNSAYFSNEYNQASMCYSVRSPWNVSSCLGWMILARFWGSSLLTTGLVGWALKLAICSACCCCCWMIYYNDWSIVMIICCSMLPAYSSLSIFVESVFYLSLPNVRSVVNLYDWSPCL